MALQVGQLFANVTANTTGFNSAMQQVQSRMNNVAGKMKDIGGKLTATLTAPILGAGVASVKLASDFEESINKVDVAFKTSSGYVKEWSETTLTNFGIAQGSALDMVATFGDMSVSMGLSTGKASEMSTALVGLVGDLASYKNIRLEEAETALTAIYTGETESLKSLGIVMTQANLERFAMNTGIEKSIKDMTEAEKVQLRYNFVMEKTSNAHGDFERTNTGAANQMRIFTEGLKQLGQQIGTILLPIFTKIITKINMAADWFSKLSTENKTTIVIIGSVAAAIGPLLVVLGTLITSITSLSAALPVLGGVLSALTGPVGIVVAVIVGLIAVFVTLYKKNDDIRQKMDNTWSFIKEKLSTVFTQIQELATVIFTALKVFWANWGDEIISIFTFAWNLISTYLETTFNVMSALLDVFIGLFSGDWDRFLNGIKTIFKSIWNGINTFYENINNALYKVGAMAWERIKANISLVNESIKSLIQDIWNKIKMWLFNRLNTIEENISTVWTSIKNIVSTINESIKTSIQTAWNDLISFLVTAFENIKSTAIQKFEALKTSVLNIWNNIKSGIKSVVDWISTKVSSILDKVKSVTNAVNSAKSLAKTIGSAAKNVTSGASSKLKNFTTGVFSGGKKILGLASGGIVNQPTLAMIGEGAESEAVVPMSKLNSLMRGGRGGSSISIGTMVVNTRATDSRSIAQSIRSELSMELRKVITT